MIQTDGQFTTQGVVRHGGNIILYIYASPLEGCDTNTQGKSREILKRVYLGAVFPFVSGTNINKANSISSKTLAFVIFLVQGGDASKTKTTW